TGSQFVAQINGENVPGTDYDQLNVTGTVNLGGATLVATGTISTVTGSQIVIINNDGADAVNGTFGSLAEGGAVIVNGHEFRITYHGGDGNDVVLRPADTFVTLVGGNLTITDITTPTDDALVIKSDVANLQYIIRDAGRI